MLRATQPRSGTATSTATNIISPEDFGTGCTTVVISNIGDENLYVAFADAARVPAVVGKGLCIFPGSQLVTDSVRGYLNIVASADTAYALGVV